MFLTIIVFLFILGLLVLVHELGHFLTAKKFGLRPYEFGIGYKPRLFGIYKGKDGNWKQVKGNGVVDDAADTIYSFNALPIGGFVDLAEDEVRADDPNHFSAKPPGQRAAILLAGVTMNFVLAAVLLAIGFMIGSPQAIDDLSYGAKVEDRKIQVTQVYPDSPADKAGFEAGDAIININGTVFGTSGELSDYVANSGGQELDYLVQRSGIELNLAVTPEQRPESGRSGIGIGIIETGIVKYPFYVAIWEGIKSTFLLIAAILSAFGTMLKSLITGNGLGADVAGPIGIAVLTGQVTKLGLSYIIQFAAILSINLGIINALPFPALDGGRVLFIILEKIKGKPVKREIEATIHYVGFALLMLLIVVVTFQDVARNVDIFKRLWEKIIT